MVENPCSRRIRMLVFWGAMSIQILPKGTKNAEEEETRNIIRDVIGNAQFDWHQVE